MRDLSGGEYINPAGTEQGIRVHRRKDPQG